MKRRGFLRALVGAAIAPVVAQAAPLFPINPAPTANLPEPGEVIYSATIRRKPGDFDMVCYLGDGTRKELPRMEFEASLIIVKCKTAPSPWYILESAELPPELNKPGEQYIAYEFGEAVMPQIEPMMDKINETFIRV